MKRVLEGLVAFSSLSALVALVACSTSSTDTAPADACDVAVDRGCTPAYEPTFDNVFRNTLTSSCALAGPSCHAPGGMKGGLVFDDPDTAHRLLLDGRVVAGKPECSLLARRLLAKDPTVTMPPGLPLAKDEQCAILQWIARGAPR